MGTTIIIVIGLLIGVTLLMCDLYKREGFIELSSLKKQLIVGVAFAVVSIIASETGSGLRDAAVICAGLIFGPIAGIVSGAISGVERYVAVLWGDSAFTQIASSMSVICAGWIAGAFHKYLTEDKNPSIFYGIIAVFVTKFFHMFMILITNASELVEAFANITDGAFALIAGNCIALIAVLLAVKALYYRKRKRQKRAKNIVQTFQLSLSACMIIAFMCTFAFTSTTQLQIAEEDVESLIKLNLKDVKEYTTSTNTTMEELYAIIPSWRIGKHGGILIFDENNQFLVGNSDLQQEIVLKDFDKLNKEKKDEVFITNVAEKNTYCVKTSYEEYTLVGYVSEKEALYFNQISLYVTTCIEILIYVMLYIIVFFLMKKLIVNNVNKINQNLQDIANGNLEVSVDVRSHKEFNSLSNYINVTVDALKGYIETAVQSIEKELEFARDIQHAAIPNTFPPYPDRKEFEIFGDMFTAKEVGGDFFDFYFVDKNKLGFIMADVSGKGVPAAMFMMVAKTMIKSYAEAGMPVNEIFNWSNRKLYENNQLGMFVTAWMGVIDLNTGVITYSNAGHNPPLLRRKDGQFEYLKSKSNLVLAAMGGIQYAVHEVTLTKGDTLFLYTDGITEAINEVEELYNEDRLCNILNVYKESDMETLCSVVKKDVDDFIGNAPQFDDITMLAFQYKGADTTMKELEIIASVENISEVTEFVDTQLEELNCPLKAQTQIDIAIDELFGNIAHYAYNPEVGPVTVRVEVLEEPLSVVITFIDNGVPYDPLKKADPNVTLSADEREAGGLGIYIVKKSMDEITYEYKEGQNILKIKKQL